MNYPEKLTSGYYRVRETWKDAESQVGQYKILAKAITACDSNPGTFVFDTEGNAIYPESKVETAVESKAETVVESKNVEMVVEKVESEDETFPTATEDAPIAYARLKTLMNIRNSNSLTAGILTTAPRGTVLEVLEFCSNGWLKVNHPAVGHAYVSNEDGRFADVGGSLYTVKRGDNLWKIAEEQLGKGERYTEIRELNGLTSNATRVGMELLMPEKLKESK